MQLTLGADGTLGVTGSAWDLDGGPVVVGFIPEPRTVLLLLTGFSLLALSRHSFGCQTGGNRL